MPEVRDKTKIRPEEQKEKAENFRGDLWNEIQLEEP